MKMLEYYGKIMAKFMGLVILGNVLLSVFYYFLFSSKVVNVLGMIYLIILFLVLGFKNGKKANEKGYLVGLKIGLLLIFGLIFLNLILYHSHFKFIRIIYYLILIFASILGGMLGINKKK